MAGGASGAARRQTIAAVFASSSSASASLSSSFSLGSRRWTATHGSRSPRLGGVAVVKSEGPSCRESCESFCGMVGWWCLKQLATHKPTAALLTRMDGFAVGTRFPEEVMAAGSNNNSNCVHGCC